MMMFGRAVRLIAPLCPMAYEDSAKKVPPSLITRLRNEGLMVFGEKTG